MEKSFPERLGPPDEAVEIKLPKPLGPVVRMYIEESAAPLPEFNEPIQCDATGTNRSGESIPVNTVGKWLFGIPGYDGNLRISAQNDKAVLLYPKNAPELVRQLVRAIKEAIETSLSK